MSNTKIFVTYKEKHQIYKSNILTPIQTGRDLAGEDFENMLGDNTGDNISFLNNYFCELSAIYWVWKNQDKIGNPNHIGFMHYRRHFLFAENDYAPNFFGLVKFNEANQDYLDNHLTNDENINRICSTYDAIIPQKIDITTLGNEKTNYEQYKVHHNIKDYEKAINIINTKYPEYSIYVDKYNNSNYAYFLNMFVFKKEIFEEYCSWLFDILFDLYDNIEQNKNDSYQQRAIGFISERLTGIFITKLLSKDYKIKELPISFIEKEVINLSYEQEKVIPIAVASSNEYVPILSTCLESIKEHSSSDYTYKINILEQNISLYNKNLLRKQFENSQINLNFINVHSRINNLSKFVDKRPFSVDTFSRFFIPDLIDYKKCIYIDLDTIVLEDLKKLYNINLDDKYLAASRDVIFLSMCCDDKIKKYAKSKLKLTHIDNYFQSGVLLLNLEKMRTNNTSTFCVEVLNKLKPYFADQCVYNYIFQDEVLYLDTTWNYQTYTNERKLKNLKDFITIKHLKNYVDAFKNPKIIHFSGNCKPWFSPNEEYAEIWWKYARKTPFYELLVQEMIEHSIINEMKLLTDFKINLINYWKCIILGKLTFGNTRKHYIDKANRLNNKIILTKKVKNEK